MSIQAGQTYRIKIDSKKAPISAVVTDVRPRGRGHTVHYTAQGRALTMSEGKFTSKLAAE